MRPLMMEKKKDIGKKKISFMLFCKMNVENKNSLLLIYFKVPRFYSILFCLNLYILAKRKLKGNLI